MPEPKNYRTWRQDIAEMIAAASGGQYRETWTLEDGRTYAVQGRPHPDGATAFLIEDISAEVTLSRSFKAEVLKFEMMLDNVTDALVVFSMTGVLTFCNAAYRDMFRQNPEAAFADVTFSDAVRLWNERIGADGDWTKLSKFIAASGSRGTQHMDVPMTSEGATLHCDMSALAGQGSLVRFSITQGQSKHGKQGLLKNQM
jgi:PAS domain-containing protein